MQEPSKKFRQVVRLLALMSTISSYFVGSVLVGIFGGRWLDKQFDTGTTFLIIGLLLGIGTAVTGIYYAIRRFLGGDQT
ncbi:F0F1-type ATP synthase assembly protein I [Evansella vedderi]|uniref:F0F1-type ATP synthase assembly protein I n=1 Tax=Evansella vedderi TaxID=38282 RepID=A0ABU0A127_9BACI|nr:AtpZ/AtpI family protein [Evansella vedderi]MDQ0257191.1 F0F1-type ATP synthase assembly protein I [Evansella vedderi]